MLESIDSRIWDDYVERRREREYEEKSRQRAASRADSEWGEILRESRLHEYCRHCGGCDCCYEECDDCDEHEFDGFAAQFIGSAGGTIAPNAQIGFNSILFENDDVRLESDGSIILKHPALYSISWWISMIPSVIATFGITANGAVISESSAETGQLSGTSLVNVSRHTSPTKIALVNTGASGIILGSTPVQANITILIS